MSSWHRDNPELVGTDADPWMMHESYRRHVSMPESERERLREEREALTFTDDGSTCQTCDGHIPPERETCPDCGARSSLVSEGGSA